MVTYKSYIDINAISIFNNQLCINHKDMKIIKNKIICKQCSTVHSLSSQCLHKIICKKNLAYETLKHMFHSLSSQCHLQYLS